MEEMQYNYILMHNLIESKEFAITTLSSYIEKIC